MTDKIKKKNNLIIIKLNILRNFELRRVTSSFYFCFIVSSTQTLVLIFKQTFKLYEPDTKSFFIGSCPFKIQYCQTIFKIKNLLKSNFTIYRLFFFLIEFYNSKPKSN